MHPNVFPRRIWTMYVRSKMIISYSLNPVAVTLDLSVGFGWSPSIDHQIDGRPLTDLMRAPGHEVLIKCPSALMILSCVRRVLLGPRLLLIALSSPRKASSSSRQLTGLFISSHHPWAVSSRVPIARPRPTTFLSATLYYLHYRRKLSSRWRMRWRGKCECAFCTQ